MFIPVGRSEQGICHARFFLGKSLIGIIIYRSSDMESGQEQRRHRNKDRAFRCSSELWFMS